MSNVITQSIAKASPHTAVRSARVALAVTCAVIGFLVSEFAPAFPVGVQVLIAAAVAGCLFLLLETPAMASAATIVHRARDASRA